VAIVAVRDPAQLVLLDAGSGRVIRRIAIIAPPRHLELAVPAGPVLVPAETANRLLELSLPAGTVRSVAVGVHPHDAAAADGRVFVGDEFGDSVSVVSAGRTVARVGGFLQPGGIAAVRDAVAVIDVRADTVTLIDAHSLRVIARAAAGDGPTHVVAAGTMLFVADTRGNAILTYATQPRLRLVGRFSLPGTPYGIAIDRGRRRLWVTLTASNELAELAIGARSLHLVATYPTGQQPNTVAVNPRDGRVFVADAGTDSVELIDPRR
jgi:DNA-binding beta-propeller fold protein YncE